MIVNEYEYNSDNTTAGYPLAIFARKEQEMYENMQIGGSSESTKFSRFENLVIPAGLVAFSDVDINQVGGNKAPKMKVIHAGVIDEKLFDSVFSTVADIKVKKPRTATRKKR
jgi:hypothetical protein